MHKLLFRLLLLGSLIISSCKRDQAQDYESAVPYLTETNLAWADSLLSNMSLEEKIGQLFIWQVPDQTNRSILQQSIPLHLSGLLIEDQALIKHISLVDSLIQQSNWAPFIASREEVLLNNQFSDVSDISNLQLINATHNDSLFQHLNQLRLRQAKALQINLVFTPSLHAQTGLHEDYLPTYADEQILTINKNFLDYFPSIPDTARRWQMIKSPIQQLIEQEISGFEISSMLPADETTFSDYFEDRLSFDGLLFSNATLSNTALEKLQSGVDVVCISTEQPLEFINAVKKAIEEERFNSRQIDHKVRRILSAKRWIHNGMDRFNSSKPSPFEQVQAAIPSEKSLGNGAQQVKVPIDQLYKHFIDTDWDYFNYEISQKGITLLSNPSTQLPFNNLLEKKFRIIDYEEASFRYFKSTFDHYADFQARQGQSTDAGVLQPIADGSTNFINVLLLDNLYPDPVGDSAFFAGLKVANSKGKLVIINFGDLKQVSVFDSTYTILQCYEYSKNTEELAAQMLFAAQDIRGRTPQPSLPNWPKQSGKNLVSNRLAYGKAKDAGIRPEKLVGINAIANSAIKKKAAPGCQVVVAKDGKIIYSQAFGHHTYRKKQRVQKDDLYDIASVTKIAATSLVAMQQYEQGTYRINDRVKNALPEFKKAPFKNTRIKDLLTHRSGIQPHLPVVPYLLYRGPENTACDSFFCSSGKSNYTIQVADQFYFKSNYIDTIWEQMNEVRIKKVRRYKYSDMNLVLMQRLLEKKGQMKLNQMTYRSFYKPLGLRHTSFNPHKYYPKKQLVPTEKDEKWRQQQVHGFVHDEAAALLGGVAGHAGLFANAEDLAVLLQMLMNEGNYGGKQYLNPATIDLFTDDDHGNHRGLIFDKRHSSNRSGRAYDLSSAAFGHTGFTGTCAWVDPEHNLVYIFLSNRVFPEKNNRKLFQQRVRTRIHQVVYDALGSYEHTWPELEM